LDTVHLFYKNDILLQNRTGELLVNESQGSQSNMLKQMPQLGQQQGVGRRDGGGKTVRSLDDREMTVVIA
jgi:hypothetical protein